MGLPAVDASTNGLAFKSKVVSRNNAEIWVEKEGKCLIKDTKSSSGKFLNHVQRPSPVNQESRPFQLKDVDILQLGVDYQGGAENIYKSVNISVEIGWEWQANENAFKCNFFFEEPQRRLSLFPVPISKVTRSNPRSCICSSTKYFLTSSTLINLTLQDRFICRVRQALFIAPCFHTFHHKCIKLLIEAHHPAFSCPLCRTYADLEEDVEVEPTDLNDADAHTDADVEIDNAPSGAAINKELADAANQPIGQRGGGYNLLNTATVKTRR